MLKLIFYGLAAFALWSTGTWGYGILAYAALEFYKGMQGGGGPSGGIQAVALKGLFAGMVYFALMSPSVHSSRALLLGLAGAIGLMTQKFPTFRLGKKMQEGIAAIKADDAAVAKLEGQMLTANDAERYAKDDEPLACAAQGLAESRDSTPKERSEQRRQPSGKQGFLNWFIHGSNGSGRRSNGSKQGIFSWLLFGSKGAPANSIQGVGSWLLHGSLQQSRGGWVSWLLFGKKMKKPKRKN